MTATLNEHVYLARVRDGSYLVRIDVGNSELEISDYPSIALHGPYAEMEQVVQRLRRRGFHQAVVTDALGVPVSSEDLRAAMANERAAPAVVAPLPKNLTQLNALSAAESKRRYKTEPDFRQQVDRLYAGR